MRSVQRPLPTDLRLAPLAGYTTLPFRWGMREVGGFGWATTELVHARSLLEGNRRAFELIETRAEDRPLSVQVFGPVAEEVRDAAVRLQEWGADAIDVNMGCPVEKVVKLGAGAAMLKEPNKTGAFVATVTRAVTIPVTVKTRLGWDAADLQAPRLAPILADAGVAALTIHGRTRAGAFAGAVDLAGIRAVVDAVPGLPVFGNGDVCDAASAKRMLEETGCAGVVIGRGALADPWVFRSIRAGLDGTEPRPTPSLVERVAFMTRHFTRAVQQRGEHLACTQFRKTIDWYAKSFGPCRPLRLAMKELRSAGQFHDLVGRFLEYRREHPVAPRPLRPRPVAVGK